MVQTIVTHECPECGSLDLVKNGHGYKGSQKYHCKTCHRYGALQAQLGYDQRSRRQVKQALLERLSLRRIERIRPTLADCLAAWSQHLLPLADTLSEARWDDVLELDEIWSFVLKKPTNGGFGLFYVGILDKLWLNHRGLCESSVIFACSPVIFLMHRDHNS